MFDEFAIEANMKQKFGLSVEVDKIIAANLDVSRTAKAVLVLTKKKQLVCYIDAGSKLLLGDIKKIISRMGLKAESYLPPIGQPDYFDEVGRRKFREVYPGRGNITDSDIVFYRTLALYNPALAIISEVKDGTIYQYDADTRGGWRPSVKFAYRRIKTI